MWTWVYGINVTKRNKRKCVVKGNRVFFTMNLDVDTQLFLQHTFPSMERINYTPKLDYVTNNVMMQVCVQYGHMGSGKTGTSRRLAEIAVDHYGEENVNACLAQKGKLGNLLRYGFDAKPIQILVVDDTTGKKVSDEVIADFFRSRHIYMEKTGNTNGYILAIFNVHRFHSLQTELRTNVDLGIWRTPPTSPYDQSIVKKFVGEDGLQDLMKIEENRLENPEWNAISVFTTRTRRGLLILNHSKVDYLRLVNRPSIPSVNLSARELARRTAIVWNNSRRQ